MYQAALESWVLKGKSESRYPKEGDKCFLSIVSFCHTKSRIRVLRYDFLKEDIHSYFFGEISLFINVH